MIGRKKRRLLDLRIMVDPDLVEQCVRRFDSGGTRWSCHHEDSPNRVGTLHWKTVDKIHSKWKSGELNFMTQRLEKDFDPLVDVSEQERQEDLGELFELLDKEKKESGIDSDDDFSGTRFNIMEQAEEMAPEHMWTFKHMRSIGMDLTEALTLLKEYDAISPDRIRAQITLWTAPYRAENRKDRLVKFRRFRRFLFMHYQMHYRTEYPPAPPFVIEVACDLRVRGEIESYPHLVIAGDGMMRYSIWEGEENLEAFYQSLRYIKSRKAAHSRFVALLDEELKSGHIFSRSAK